MSLLIHPEENKVFYHYRYKASAVIHHVDVTEVVFKLMQPTGYLNCGRLDIKANTAITISGVHAVARAIDPKYSIYLLENGEGYITPKDVKVILKMQERLQQKMQERK